jgi:UDP-N-acetylglucosamine:LPS N-acetylglucosamine transferase
MKKIYLLLYAFLLINTIKSDFVNGVKSIFDNQNDKKKDDSTVSILALGGAIGTTFIGNNVKDLKNQLQEAIDDKNQLSLQLQSSQLQSLENNRQEYNQLTEKYNEALEKINSLNKQIDAKLLEKKTEKLNLENPSVLSVENIPVNKLLQQPLPLPL